MKNLFARFSEHENKERNKQHSLQANVQDVGQNNLQGDLSIHQRLNAVLPQNENQAVSFSELAASLIETAHEWHRQIDKTEEPSRRQEKWKYTSLDKVSWNKSKSVMSTDANDFLKLSYENEKWGLSKNSNLVSIARLGDLLSDGCETRFQTSLSRAIKSLINADLSYFEKINWLSPLDATVVLVKRYSEETEHLKLQFLGEVQLAKPLLFVFEERAELKVFEDVRPQGGSFIFSSFYFLSKGANLERVAVQTADELASCFHQPRIILQDEAVLRNFDISLGAKLSRHDLNVKVDGNNAEAHVFGLYVVSADQTHDHQTFVHHRSPHSTSRQFYKGLMNERGRAVFNGRIEIDPVAQKTDSSQLNKNLMLSSTAEIFAKPELEVGADDVKAAHGATIGQLQKEEVFYLQSRAISKEAAIEILSEGFAQEIAFEIQNETLKKWATQKIKKRLETIGDVIL